MAARLFCGFGSRTSTSARESYPSCICDASTFQAELSSGSRKGPSDVRCSVVLSVLAGSEIEVSCADRGAPFQRLRSV
eukprot:1441140-Rhodomonas_salina.1